MEAALVRVGRSVDGDVPVEGDALVEGLGRFLELLLAKNRELNLTAVRTFEDAAVLHIEDSLVVLPEFSLADGEFCDIGTGGGIPGIPLALASGRGGVLLDSVRKKATAVSGFIDELGLGDRVCAVGDRSELFATEHSGEFGVVVVRAVASLVAVMELATPLLRRSGVLVAMRGTESEGELEAARRAAEMLGLEEESARTFEIGPEGNIKRSAYCFRLTGEPTVSLPRRPGMAVKRPLVRVQTTSPEEPQNSV